MKIGTYLKSRCEKSLPKNIMGIGRWMQRNQLRENFFVFDLRNPKGRLSMKVSEKIPTTRAAFAPKSIVKNTLKRRLMSKPYPDVREKRGKRPHLISKEEYAEDYKHDAV